jgi:mRNA interferase RelE/StbE
MYRLSIKRSARKELDSLPDKTFLKVDRAIVSLKGKPFPYPQSRRLEGEDNHRLRVGDYRVVYSVNEEEKVITVFRVRHRKDVYR